MQKNPFKFANVLATLTGFTPLVKKYWSSTEELFVSTSALFRFAKKIEGFKAGFKGVTQGAKWAI